MTSDEVAELVRRQIGDGLDAPHAHGVDLRRCLVLPRRIRVEASWAVQEGEDRGMEVWLVLEECPETKDGYKIVYDEEDDCFGLACPGSSADNPPVYLGEYGDFMTTLEAM